MSERLTQRLVVVGVPSYEEPLPIHLLSSREASQSVFALQARKTPHCGGQEQRAAAPPDLHSKTLKSIQGLVLGARITGLTIDALISQDFSPLRCWTFRIVRGQSK